MKVICTRGTLRDEPGTHLVDVSIFQGAGRGVVSAYLFIEKQQEKGEGYVAVVKAGCTRALNLHPLGDKVGVYPTRNGGFRLQSEE